MNDYSQMDKNTVAAENQLKGEGPVRFLGPDGRGKRIMLTGNSITLHDPKPDIGWYGQWGMAASAPERDYVHLLADKIRAVCHDASVCVCQAAEWERQYKNGSAAYPLFTQARDFRADVIVMRLIENCGKQDFEPAVFKKQLAAFLDFLDGSGKAKIIMTTGFWRHPGDDAIRELAAGRGLPCIELGDLGERDDMKAVGLFEHKGVAAHPGDLGMKTIADRIFGELKEML